jgi:hypothetical protein
MGGQIGEGDGIGVAVFFTFFFLTGFLAGFLVGFLVEVDEGDAFTVELDFVAVGFGEVLEEAEGLADGVAAYELVTANNVLRNIEITNLYFIAYSI